MVNRNGSDHELIIVCSQVCREEMKRRSRNWLGLKAPSHRCVTGPRDCSGLACVYIKLWMRLTAKTAFWTASALGGAIWKDKSSTAWEEIFSPREQDITNSVRTSKSQALWFSVCFAEPRCPLPLSSCLLAPPPVSSLKERRVCWCAQPCMANRSPGLEGEHMLDAFTAKNALKITTAL